MKNFTTYLFVMLMAMFWIFRIVVSFCYSLGIEFFAVPFDEKFEIILLFVALISIVLVVKRNMFGALMYLVGYELYFGTILFNSINAGGNIQNYTDIFFSFIGIVLPLFVVFDLLLDKNRKEHPTDKKTDWFYKNKNYDREYDERADKNNYKFL